MKKNKCIVFTGGGTGGHIYPGLGIADEFRLLCPDIKTIWIGASSGMDKKLVEKSGSIDLFKGIPSGKLRRYFSLKNFVDLFKIIGGYICAIYLLLKYKPLVVFSKGGFVSVPPCLAAKLLNIPVYTHECDYSPGLATRINSRAAKKILVSFEKTKDFFDSKKQQKVIVTGNPVRPIFYTANATRGLEFLQVKPTKPILLVLGGSLGARQLNELVFENLDWLCEHFIIVHQTGKSQFDQAVAQKNVNPKRLASYMPYAFFYAEMPDVMASADIVLSRAGSNFLWECAVTGKPLVLIPLCGAGTRGDQVENAEYFTSKKAAFSLVGKEVSSDNLKNILLEMLNVNKRKTFEYNVKKLVTNTKPALEIAKLLEKEVRGL
ncbi:MAG: undecaprenyldiphospho-muramoylpentapeptide beta-N-acetylglucosaminyltransferase [Treponema sp. CETP13]|nr:MAG: undecaprenyldiphospho-muramoylpentapeptide beta-N-acetylglucosaminyltransferase [Treponema sp. CETP13]